MNTAISTAVVAMIGPVTSCMALRAAASGARPASSWRSTFSTTTMASSTTRPMASTMPSRESMLSEKPSRYMTVSVAISDTGMAISGMTVVRQLCRKMKTTKMTSSRASTSVTITSVIAADTKRVVS